MKTTFLILATFLVGFVANAQNTEVFLNQYLKMKDAMVQSDSRTTQVEGNKFYEMLEKSEAFPEKKNLLKATQKLGKTMDIEKQRAAMNEVSVILWKVIKNSGNIKQNVYYQYCPMKKSYWLSNESAIKNPYYGAKMLNCGNVSDKKLK